MQELKLMSRRNWMWLALALGACGRNAPLPAGFFPETVANVWRRTAARNLPVSEAPDPVPRTSVERLLTASYAGPGKLEARAYELDSPVVGPDLARRWRPSSDTVYFSRGRWFVVVKWQQADRGALQAFLQEVERRIQGAPSVTGAGSAGAWPASPPH
jgi:hypothetical protein